METMNAKAVDEMTVKEFVSLLSEGVITRGTVQEMDALGLFRPVALMRENGQVEGDAVNAMLFRLSGHTLSQDLASLSTGTEELFNQYVEWTDPADRATLVAMLNNPACPSSVLEVLIDKISHDVGVCFCEDFYGHAPEVLEALCEHPNLTLPLIRAMVSVLNEIDLHCVMDDEQLAEFMDLLCSHPNCSA